MRMKRDNFRRGFVDSFGDTRHSCAPIHRVWLLRIFVLLCAFVVSFVVVCYKQGSTNFLAIGRGIRGGYVTIYETEKCLRSLTSLVPTLGLFLQLVRNQNAGTSTLP